MSMTMTSHSPYSAQPRPVPVSVQILSTILYGAFAITAIAKAFPMFWPAGFVLAIILGWRGGFVSQNAPQMNPEEIVERVRALSPEAKQRSTGNSSFDAYREDTLKRLDEEQDSFEGFLERLRSARDKQEFDNFMDERIQSARSETAAQDD
ncbi:MAG: DUF2852 domain-containing protein [Maritimibacter sp.]